MRRGIVSAAITGGGGAAGRAALLPIGVMPTLQKHHGETARITLYNNDVELAASRVNPQGSWTYPLTRNLRTKRV